MEAEGAALELYLAINRLNAANQFIAYVDILDKQVRELRGSFEKTKTALMLAGEAPSRDELIDTNATLVNANVMLTRDNEALTAQCAAMKEHYAALEAKYRELLGAVSDRFAPRKRKHEEAFSHEEIAPLTDD